MVEISTSILTVSKGEESATFFELEASKTDYFHIDVMDGKFVEKDTYQKMLEYASYIKRISNLPLDVHLMVEDVKSAIDDFLSVEPNIITFHLEACKSKEEVFELIKYINNLELSNYDGIIVLHGTDTLAYTAALLSFAFAKIPVPIFIVSGNRPPHDKLSNANANFTTAVELIWSGIAPNVYVTYRNTEAKHNF